MMSKKEKKTKLKTVAQLSQVIAECIQLIVRLKAADDNGYCSCVTCGVPRHYKDNMHGGHFIPRQFSNTRCLEENIHPQCAKCNSFLRGNLIRYTIFMIDTYGREFVDELETLKTKVTKKWDRKGLEEEITERRQQIAELESRVWVGDYCGRT